MNRDGYAFPLALAAIAIISLIAAVAAARIESDLAATRDIAQTVEIDAEAKSAEQTFIFLALTEPMTGDGLAIGGSSARLARFGLDDSGAGASVGAIVRPDGSPVQIESLDRAIIRYADIQAFLNATPNDPVGGELLLEAFQTPQTLRPSLIAALLDYQDPDDVRRIGGAESRDYDNPEQITNEPLRGPDEICAVKGWAETAVCSDRGMLLLLSRPRPSSELNARFATRPLLRRILDDNAEAETALSLRSTMPTLRFSDLGAATFDRVLDPAIVTSGPRTRFSLITQTRDAAYLVRADVHLTPGSRSRPFAISGRYRIGGLKARDEMRIGPDDEVPVFAAPE